MLKTVPVSPSDERHVETGVRRIPSARVEARSESAIVVALFSRPAEPAPLPSPVPPILLTDRKLRWLNDVPAPTRETLLAQAAPKVSWPAEARLAGAILRPTQKIPSLQEKLGPKSVAIPPFRG